MSFVTAPTADAVGPTEEVPPATLGKNRHHPCIGADPVLGAHVPATAKLIQVWIRRQVVSQRLAVRTGVVGQGDRIGDGAGIDRAGFSRWRLGHELALAARDAERARKALTISWCSRVSKDANSS